MKIRIECQSCKSEGKQQEQICTTQEISNNGLYEVICPNGHKNTVYLQTSLYEVLFESGILALADGYYRECVSSIASSLERFYEFYTRVVCVKRQLDWSEFINCWKKTSTQSERQFGAFLFLYLLEYGKYPTTLSNKLTEFRNNVIHKGYFPSEKEAIFFAKKVADIVGEHFRELREANSEDVLKTIAVDAIERGVLGSRPVTTMWSSNVLTRHSFKHEKQDDSFENEIEKIKRERQSIFAREG